jgi:hypothetical protein
MFIEIKRGVYVKAEDIEAVIDTVNKKDAACRVYTKRSSYLSVLPSKTILDIIGTREDLENPEQTQQEMLNIIKQQNNPMGG